MLFLKLFLVFSKIGIFSFGGGYAMLSLIYNDVVVENEWISDSEFTDIVAISQSTPGPIGINSATYVGYTSVINEGYPIWMGILGAFLATFSVIWLPFLLMITVSRYIISHKDKPFVKDVFSLLRPAIIGLIAAAALLLMNEENFGNPSSDLFSFIVSIALFIGAFVATRYFKVGPITAFVVAGVIGLLVY